MVTSKKKGTPKKTPREISNANLRRGGYTKDKQPSSEAKKAGRDRKKQKQAMLDKILEIYNMDAGDFDIMLKSIKAKIKKGDKAGVTAGELALVNYVHGVVGGKFILDRMDRHIGKAPQEIKQTGEVTIAIGLKNPFSKKQD